MGIPGAGSAHDAESAPSASVAGIPVSPAPLPHAPVSPAPAEVPGPVPRGVVVLVRHGETEWSAAGRHTGRTDVPLTELGRQQAEGLGRLLSTVLAGRRVLATLSSPLSRARDTAELAGLTGVREEPALREIEYGTYEGLTTAAIRADDNPGWSVWTGELPAGETLAEVACRVDELIGRIRDELAAAADEDPPPAVVLVGHGHLLRVLAARWIGLPPSAGALFALGTAAVSVLGREHETPVLVHWNMPAGDP
jgi:broad specificity phosphatase PhoE